ncbi:MAG: type II toxin-antitoxin system VapC family toxin [Armatimonadetes bacterium]|nr:type II toxin-antitoxin system VapC family toxin [Armatimonadota bacterium]
MSRYVLDTSALIKVVLPEPGSEQVVSLVWEAVRGDSQLFTLDFAFLEAANVLWKRCVREELSDAPPQRLLATLLGLSPRPIQVVNSRQVLKRALELSIALGLPVYDCAFVALCEHQQAALVTGDRQQAKAVSAVSTILVPPPLLLADGATNPEEEADTASSDG